MTGATAALATAALAACAAFGTSAEHGAMLSWYRENASALGLGNEAAMAAWEALPQEDKRAVAAVVMRRVVAGEPVRPGLAEAVGRERARIRTANALRASARAAASAAAGPTFEITNCTQKLGGGMECTNRSY